ncbi:helix-turn-helix transcriptional regulator [Psychrobacillus sp. FSL K6-4615]|uniref:helix-turn-helix domain-containing protein n=1 Tax=Psychrobacillus sp. FSL K6-4615 TaxID=2921551 RepID=UPI0030F6E76D
MTKEIGSTISVIRRNKGYSQGYVSEGSLTQGAYSKFENLNTGIRINTFKELLAKLEMSLDEFGFIHNGYKYNVRDQLINRLFDLSYNNKQKLEQLLAEVTEYLKVQDDILLENLSKICESLILLSETGKIEQARIPVQDVWDSLSKRNHFYIIDIYFISSILFLFPLETALEIKKFAFRSIDRYKDFQNIERIKINISINITLLLMKEGRFSEALDETTQIINLCKKHRDYLRLAICYVRKGICLNSIEMSGENWILKGINMLIALEEDNMVEILEDEIKRYEKILV